MPKKKTQEVAIEEFHQVQGDSYDYSLVEYVNTHTKVTVICPKHGEFRITPNHHRHGVGCRECYDDSQKITKEEFVSRAQNIFGNRYDYSLFNSFQRLTEEVSIRCVKHGEIFQQEARNHIKGHTGCSKCLSNKLSGARDNVGRFKSDAQLTQDFIKQARRIHGDTYIYSNVQYVKNSVKVRIICAEHGEFLQTPASHLKGHGCSSCPSSTGDVSTISFRQKCEQLGVDYWRALKRREAGHPEEKIFDKDCIRHSRELKPITVHGIKYPNYQEAVRALNPPASPRTIMRLITEKGMTPEKAFAKLPNPGYMEGIIYLITNRLNSKKYVGQTVQTLKLRWKNHVEQAFAGQIDAIESLHVAIRESGPENFDVQQIDEGIANINLEEKEKAWIRRLNTLAPNGYNILAGGGSGGSNKKRTLVDGKWFDSRREAAYYVAETRGIGFHAAEARIRFDRVELKPRKRRVQNKAKKKVYGAWSRIKHCITNPKSKDYIPGIKFHEPWHDFRTFYKDVGSPLEREMVFARLDKTKGFFPDNCAWMSKSEAGRLNVAHLRD